MANSFLVTASADANPGLLPDESLAYIYSSGRYPAYRKANTFVQSGTGTLIKRALINPEYPAPVNATLFQVISDEEYIPGSVISWDSRNYIATGGRLTVVKCVRHTQMQ